MGSNITAAMSFKEFFLDEFPLRILSSTFTHINTLLLKYIRFKADFKTIFVYVHKISTIGSHFAITLAGPLEQVSLACSL